MEGFDKEFKITEMSSKFQKNLTFSCVKESMFDTQKANKSGEKQ